MQMDAIIKQITIVILLKKLDIIFIKSKAHLLNLVDKVEQNSKEYAISLLK